MSSTVRPQKDNPTAEEIKAEEEFRKGYEDGKAGKPLPLVFTPKYLKGYRNGQVTAAMSKGMLHWCWGPGKDDRR